MFKLTQKQKILIGILCWSKIYYTTPLIGTNNTYYYFSKYLVPQVLQTIFAMIPNILEPNISNKLSPIKFSASSIKRLSKFFRYDKISWACWYLWDRGENWKAKNFQLQLSRYFPFILFFKRFNIPPYGVMESFWYMLSGIIHQLFCANLLWFWSKKEMLFSKKHILFLYDNKSLNFYSVSKIDPYS